MQEAVESELAQGDLLYVLKNNWESRELFYFLTKAERNYVQNVYDEGFDKDEKNRELLGNLLKTSVITGGNITTNTFYPNSYTVILPTDLLRVGNERADITTSEGSLTDLMVIPILYDEYNVNKNNPFRKPTNEKCLRL